MRQRTINRIFVVAVCVLGALALALEWVRIAKGQAKWTWELPVAIIASISTAIAPFLLPWLDDETPTPPARTNPPASTADP